MPRFVATLPHLGLAPSRAHTTDSGSAILAATMAVLLAASAARAEEEAAAPADEPTLTKPRGASPLQEILVTAQHLSLPMYSEPVLSIPQTVNIVSNELMTDQAVTSMRNALRNVSGISIGAGEGSYQGDNFSIRGFAARSDIFLDGMSDFGNYTRDTFNTEEIEVLKGPSSVAFGRGAAGGAVNSESKSPLLNGFEAFGLMFGTDATRRATLDVDTPLPALAGAALRVTAMAHTANIAERSGPYYDRWGVAPSIAIGLGTATRFQLNYLYQQQHDLPDYGIPWILDRPAPVARTNYYGFTDGANYFRGDINIGTVKFEHDFSDSVTLREQFHVANYHRALQISQGDPPGNITPETPLATVVVDRTQIDGISTDRSTENDLAVQWRLHTGTLEHTLLGGIDYLRQTVDPRRVEPCWIVVPPTSLLYPQPSDPFTGVPGGICTNVQAYVNTSSAYLIDTVKSGERWTFLAALRVDHMASSYVQLSPPAISFSATNTLPTYRLAVVYQPRPTVSYYIATGTSVHPNVQQISILNEAPLTSLFDNLGVGKNTEYEIGAKWVSVDNQLSATGALFTDHQVNPAGVDVDDPLNYVKNAAERISGAEVSLSGRLTTAWQLLVNYSYQNGIVTDSSDPQLIGRQVLNAPRNTTSLWTTYDVTATFQIGAGLNQVSSRTAWEVPDPVTGLIKEASGYVIGNAMARYRINDHIEIQANLSNLTNKYYYDGVHPGHVVPGEGRALFISANARY
jgi:catecholate siderophore receptor